MVEELEERILALRESILAETHLVYECDEILLQVSMVELEERILLRESILAELIWFRDSAARLCL